MSISQLDINVYISVPSSIRAVLVTQENLHDVAKWCEGDVGFEKLPNSMEIGSCVHVPTINGPANAFVGHYVIRGPNDFYPCDPDTFQNRWRIKR